jgi:hypothetical protein
MSACALAGSITLMASGALAGSLFHVSFGFEREVERWSILPLWLRLNHAYGLQCLCQQYHAYDLRCPYRQSTPR